MTVKEFMKRKRKAVNSDSHIKVPVVGCECIDCYYLRNGSKFDREIEKHPIAMPRKVRGT